MIHIGLLIIIMFSIFSCTPPKNVQSNEPVQYDTLTQTEVYAFAEKMPQYKGGNQAFMNEFGRKFHYEFKEAEEIQSTVKVQFVIDRKGRLSGERIYNKKEEEWTDFEKEVLRTVNSLQNWEPGRQDNKKVDVMITRVIHIHSLME